MRRMKSFILPVICLCLAVGGVRGQDTAPAFPANGPNYRMFPADRPPLVPMPQQVKWSGRAVPVQSVRIQAPAPARTSYPEQMKFIVSELKSFLAGHGVQVSQEGAFAVKFVQGDVKAGTENPKLKEEAYSLRVTPGGALIMARDTKGFYYGLKTLEQLLLRRDGKTTIAACDIVDWPDFEVRGFMNDVGRNYMPLPLIAQELDSMGQLKLNVYHFHFTENPGWRLESRIYPELNDPKNFTRMPGKFYTQKEFKQLVEYCRLRNILLIPEMDMPGHSAAFRKALGVKMSDEKATKALVALIKEMCSLVPKEKMPIIHIGTDEAHGKDEQVNDAILKEYVNAVESCGRTPMRWQPA